MQQRDICKLLPEVIEDALLRLKDTQSEGHSFLSEPSSAKRKAVALCVSHLVPQVRAVAF